MIKQIIEKNTIKLDFFVHSAEVEAFGTTIYSSAETLEDAQLNVEMHTESSSSNVLISTGSWYAAYLSKYKDWFVGRVLETYTIEIKVDFLQQHSQDVNRFSTREEIENIPKTCIFYKIAGEPVPISSSRTSQLKLLHENYNNIKKIFLNLPKNS